MKYRINVFFLIIFILFPILYCNESDKPIIAFGYLTNKSDKKKYNYLETVFPNSFASSIKTIFKVQTKTPDQIDNLLRNQNQSLKKKYDHLELSYLVKMIGADIFVSGSFEPLTKKLIKITLAVYIDGSNEIFEFTNIEKMETQIASLIDRVTLNVINYMSENNLYMRNRISPGARLAILTNLDGEEQNRLLSTFMKKGYTISSLQNNYLINPFNNDNFEFFRFI
ncbi:MAG: hypothetical protein SVR08_09625, partial [Spirochaetota bacterium]|nr:hypothetical protein [Spirochaetota bacterium]